MNLRAAASSSSGQAGTVPDTLMPDVMDTNSTQQTPAQHSPAELQAKEGYK